MSTQLIVALDFDDRRATHALVNQLHPAQCALKVGSELFTLFGTELVRELVAKQFKVFLDLKFHDIPNTVARASAAAAELGVWMINVHAMGGLVMMQAARQALDKYGVHRPLLIAVTALTSLSEADLLEFGIHSLADYVVKLACLAQKAGLDGVVCSALEARAIKEACGDSFLTITPGIRLGECTPDDQSRTVTPEMAVQAGSDYLVVGRPITRAAHPLKAINDLLLTIASV